MKVGDLVKCIWQPSCVSFDRKTRKVTPLDYTIKDEFGIIVRQRLDIDHHTILFPKFGYEHVFSSGAFEVISEEA